jgi:hypothetical protein
LPHRSANRQTSGQRGSDGQAGWPANGPQTVAEILERAWHDAFSRESRRYPVGPLLRAASALAGRGPGRRVTEASDEWGQTFEISVLRDEGDPCSRQDTAISAALRSDGLSSSTCLPSWAATAAKTRPLSAKAAPDGANTRRRRSKGSNTPCCTSRAARAVRAPAASSCITTALKQVNGSARLRKAKNLGLRVLVSEAVDEDVRVECVLHVFRERSKTSSTPPLRHTAANPSASSSRNATRSRAWSIASVSVSTPNARRATSSFRWSMTTFFRTQPARLPGAR